MDKIKETKRVMRLREWSEMYRSYQESGKTVAVWCSDQKLSAKTFYYRLRKVREAALESTEKYEIVPITTQTVTFQKNESSHIKISGNRISVELTENISPEMIAIILEGLISC